MTGTSSRTGEADLDVSEFFLLIWSRKWVVFISMALAIVAGGYFFFSAPKTYTAEAVFALEDDDSLQVPSIYGGAADLLLGRNGNDKGLLDRLEGRNFILKLADEISLEDDTYFNPPVKGPSLFSISGVLLRLGLSKPMEPTASDAIVSSYKRNVRFSETKSGSIRVSVKHVIPSQSALIANAIVSQVVDEIEEEERESHRSQLNYLSQQVADALDEVEAAKNAVAQSSLNNGRVSLDILRRQERLAEASYNTLVEQVKIKTLTMGYPGKPVRVYQLAAPPLTSSPKPSVVLAVSIVAGGLLGMVVALLLGRRQGKVYSLATVKKLTQPKFVVSTAALRRLASPSRKWNQEEYRRVDDPALLELAASVLATGRKIILIMSTGPKVSSLPVGMWLAHTIAAQDQAVSLFLLDIPSPPTAKACPEKSLSEWRVGTVNVLSYQHHKQLDALQSLNSVKTMMKDKGKDEVVIVVTSSRYASTAARDLCTVNPFSALVFQEGRTSRRLTEQVVDAITVDAVVNIH